MLITSGLVLAAATLNLDLDKLSGMIAGPSSRVAFAKTSHSLGVCWQWDYGRMRFRHSNQASQENLLFSGMEWHTKQDQNHWTEDGHRFFTNGANTALGRSIKPGERFA
jgi:hypothetical protein